MTPFSLESVRGAVNAKAVNAAALDNSGGREVFFTGVSTDSRTIKAGELFFALKGDNFDAHGFMEDVSRIAAGAVVSRKVASTREGFIQIEVDDTLQALQRLAAHARGIRPLKVIAITGSNGKTTTKEMAAAVLAKKYTVLKTEGNLNNHIGLPLTLLRLGGTEDAAVLEMGASKAGDIAELCEIAAPDIGILTNIGPGHLEGFGSMEGVRAAKLELMDFLSAKTIIVNGDDDFLMEGVTQKNKTLKKEIITIGIEKDADISGRIITGMDTTALRAAIMFPNGQEIDVTIQSGGAHNVYNALSAAAAGYLMGVPREGISQALCEFKGVAMRLEHREINGSMVICDFYNANPASTANALKELARLKKDRAVAVLGDMLELGPHAEQYHRELGRWMAAQPVDLFIAVGPLMKMACEEFKSAREALGMHVNGSSVCAASAVEAGRMLKESMSGATVLIKGSRGLKMERVLE
ncbi:MAG: UDP-N-acetylmuramoyl-tripeptide--D-alanyl-D-alanine ligase [Nitrospirae bacterium]|nr:UDP-N-acetylmuramoyl-tripeptide--D-alanyl-D-alanine ligase [Nitrospirota bacterium]